ncbi:MAG TPA: molybdenum cofactor biosynthesis protein MoaE [Pantanalinema sp.]
MLLVTPEAIDPAALERLLSHPAAGGVVTFSGVVRDHNEGREVLFLEYEAYPEMATSQLQDIHRRLAERWRVERVVMVHRTGRLAIGEVAVFVGVAAAHRAEAFDACRFGIDTIKRELPIWKKEHFVGGEVWVEGCCG